MNNINTGLQFLNLKGLPIDALSSVGSKSTFKTIDEMLIALPDSVFSSGMLVNDFENGITWQLYYNGAWKARIYDGVIHVKAVDTNGIDPTWGFSTVDGISLGSGDSVLLAGTIGPLCGIYIWDGSSYTRHPLFDESVDSLTGITIVATDGISYKNSQWKFVTPGVIIPDGNLSVTAQDFANDPTTFLTYTYLNFEMLGGHYTPSGFYPLDSGRYDFDMFIDSSSGDVECGKQDLTYFPNKEYTWVKKTDDNIVIVSPSTFRAEGSFVENFVLLNKGDYLKVKLLTNPVVNADSFIYYTNRVNKIITLTVNSDGLIYTVPEGYLLYSITGKLTTPTDNTEHDYVLLTFGKENDGNANLDALDLNNDGNSDTANSAFGNKFITDPSITTIWATSVHDWDGAKAEIKIHLVKL